MRAAERTSFRMLHKTDLTPIKYERICPRHETVVPWDEIVKGYEYDKGKFDYNSGGVDEKTFLQMLQK